MSDPQKQNISEIINWGFKIAIGIAAWLAMNTFTGMSNKIDAIDSNMQTITKEVIHIGDQVQRNKEDIRQNRDEIKDIKGR